MNTSPNNRLNCAGTAEHASTMKRIGLLGGMSWESTALYYQLLNQGVAERLGGLHSADLVLISVDFAPIARLQAEGQLGRAGMALANRARALQAAGADLAAAVHQHDAQGGRADPGRHRHPAAAHHRHHRARRDKQAPAGSACSPPVSRWSSRSTATGWRHAAWTSSSPTHRRVSWCTG